MAVVLCDTLLSSNILVDYSKISVELDNFVKAQCANIIYSSKFQREFPKHHKLETERKVEHHHCYPQTIELIKHVFILLFRNI